MPFTICSDIDVWIEEEITRRVKTVVEDVREVCEDLPWPIDWFCETVTDIIEVFVDVIDIVGRLVVRTVCKVVSIATDAVSAIVKGFGNIIAGVFTLDWQRIADGFAEIAGAFVSVVAGAIRIIFLGDAIDYFSDEIAKHRLKNHVRDLLDAKYGDDPELGAIKKAIGLDAGAFGLRLKGEIRRAFVDSRTKRRPSDAVPNLLALHTSGAIDLKRLAGFEEVTYFNRSRPEPLLVVDPAPPLVSISLSEDELDEYIGSGGGGKPFRIYSMSESVVDTKVDAARVKGREIGLELAFDTGEIELVNADHIRLKRSLQVQLLRDVAGRSTKASGMANQELCRPFAIAVFPYAEEALNGQASCLYETSCQEEHEVSGVTFKDRQPDWIWQYVPIHELGHWLGLCHATAGVDRIMYSNVESESPFSWKTLPQWLWLEGEPSFTLDEAKAAWDYIVAHFPKNCLVFRGH